jgi:hypothetical protein
MGRIRCSDDYLRNQYFSNFLTLFLALTLVSATDLGRQFFVARYVLITIFAFSLFRMQFFYMIIVSTMQLGGLMIATVINFSLNLSAFPNIYLTYIWSLIAMGLALRASYSIEKHAKKDFLIKRLVEVERQRIKSEQVQADKLVKELYPSKIIKLFGGNLELAEVPHITNSYYNIAVMVAHVEYSLKLSENTEDSMKHLVHSLNSKFFLPVERKAREQHLDMVNKHGLRNIKFVGTINTENPAERLAELSFFMHYLISIINQQSLEKYSVSIKIAIHVGDCFDSITGASLFNYDFYGEPWRVARAMAKYAKPGQTLVSDDIRFFLASSFMFQGDYSVPLGADKNVSATSINLKSLPQTKEEVGTFLFK